MALQGTLDTFALPDVLRLLGSTSKTGRLRVNGDRGSGSVWVTDGQVVATENMGPSSGSGSAVDTIFDMLRYRSGSFTFESDATTSAAGSPESVEAVLSQAEMLLAEWQTIAEVVPSLDAWATLRPELVGRDVVIDSSRWRVIVSVGSGASVGQIGEALGLTEIPACRAVKELVDLQLVEVGDVPANAAVPTYVEAVEVADVPAEAAVAAPVPEPVEAFEPLSAVETPTFEPIPDSYDDYADDAAAVEISTSAIADSWSAEPLPSVDRGPIGFDSLAIDEVPESMHHQVIEAAPPAPAAVDEVDPAEMARQLANLSPKAAKAVAAAAKATTAAEREAALAAVEAEGESVDRGLLLKFLGSVDG